jgi:hypothetical protein
MEQVRPGALCPELTDFPFFDVAPTPKPLMRRSVMLVVGSSAVDVIPYLIDRHHAIRTLRFVQYKRRSETVDICPTCRSRISPRPITRRLRHDTHDRRWHILQRQEATSHNLLRLIADLPQDEALALTSRLTLTGRRIRHLPMIDFQGRHEDTDTIAKGVRKLHPEGGILMQTTNSYHFYGHALLTHSAWVQFIGKCLLLGPEVDVRWHGHRLMEGWSSLRISRDPRTTPTRNEPTVLALLEPMRCQAPC